MKESYMKSIDDKCTKIIKKKRMRTNKSIDSLRRFFRDLMISNAIFFLLYFSRMIHFKGIIFFRIHSRVVFKPTHPTIQDGPFKIHLKCHNVIVF